MNNKDSHDPHAMAWLIIYATLWNTFLFMVFFMSDGDIPACWVIP